ncbi:MAG: hypothetical protein ACOC9P_00890 [bacterium]
MDVTWQKIDEARIILTANTERQPNLEPLLRLQVALGAVEAARQTVLEVAGSLSEQLDGYTSIAIAQAETGDPDGAEQTLLDVTAATIELDPDHDGCNHKAAWQSALPPIIEARAQRGELEIAKKLTAELAASDQERADVLLCWLHVYVGDVETAKQIATRVEELLTQISCYRTIAEQQACNGDLAGAKKTAEMIVDPRGRAETYRAIGAAAGKLGNLDGAKKALEQAKEVVISTGSELAEPRTMWHEIGTTQADIGDIEGAEETAASWPKHWIAQTCSLPAIAAAKARAGNLCSAKETVAKIKPPFRYEAWVRMAAALAESGDLRAAEGIIKMDFPGRDRACLWVIEACAQAGDIPAAEAIARSVQPDNEEEHADLVLAIAKGLAARARQKT